MSTDEIEARKRRKNRMLLAILTGVVIFISDFLLGWLSIVSGPIPVIFVIAIIIGLIAGDSNNALKSTCLAWMFGLSIGAVMVILILFRGIYDPMMILSFPETILFAGMLSLRGFFNLYWLTNWPIPGYAGDMSELINVISMTIILYIVSIGIGILGGKLAYNLEKRIRGVDPEQIW